MILLKIQGVIWVCDNRIEEESKNNYWTNAENFAQQPSVQQESLNDPC